VLRRFPLQAGLFLLILSGYPLYAVELMKNGGFESLQLAPWVDASTGPGRVNLLNKGACLADTDTRAIQIHGKKAAILHANSGGSSGSNPILRSDSFIAGNGVAFIALSGGLRNSLAAHDLKLQVDLVDANSDNTIVSQVFSPSSIRLETGCTGRALVEHTEAKPFSSHYFSTQAYSGQSIRLQFKLAPEAHPPGSSFILLDQVVVFKPGEQAIFHSKPYAQAGVQRSSKGRLYLSARGSFDPDRHPAPLDYSWYLDNKVYRTPNPCLTDYDEGNYRVVLYVNDGHYAVSDLTHFYVSKQTSPADTIQDKECTVIRQVQSENTKNTNAINTALLSWAEAWSERKVKQYINAYRKEYAPAEKQHLDWAAERRHNFGRKTFIKISLSEIHVEQYKDRYQARFTQRYESNSYRDTVDKELIFALQNNQWKIVKETIR
jgi:hypothetical protein